MAILRGRRPDAVGRVLEDVSARRDRLPRPPASTPRVREEPQLEPVVVAQVESDRDVDGVQARVRLEHLAQVGEAWSETPENSRSLGGRKRQAFGRLEALQDARRRLHRDRRELPVGQHEAGTQRGRILGGAKVDDLVEAAAVRVGPEEVQLEPGAAIALDAGGNQARGLRGEPDRRAGLHAGANGELSRQRVVPGGERGVGKALEEPPGRQPAFSAQRVLVDGAGAVVGEPAKERRLLGRQEGGIVAQLVAQLLELGGAPGHVDEPRGRQACLEREGRRPCAPLEPEDEAQAALRRAPGLARPHGEIARELVPGPLGGAGGKVRSLAKGLEGVGKPLVRSTGDHARKLPAALATHRTGPRPESQEPLTSRRRRQLKQH